ncbi:hypothetical protein JAAARDRAFT_210238 [Jaapia argillacea MUCL 33604]|uniref:Uncharacterized protein n=1 Tax=Jaapia argillacea MUCL 33604 TaxID=933084 RepID=A0A067PRQ0_9AGAM|nr:hypothetical protein JAAARDRAFT_210238 [Jaapia argillacea MUCL 33604]
MASLASIPRSEEEVPVSLEPHLLDALTPLLTVLPSPLAGHLSQYTQPNTSSTTIPYSLLFSISKWSRTLEGHAALTCHTPPLDPKSYTMVALLAGTRSFPDRAFPIYVSKEQTLEEERRRRISDRKAITTLLNALLSIGGAGFATWYAADHTGLRNEWRVLLALFAAMVVAISEGILYLIWSSRKASQEERKRKQKAIRATAVPPSTDVQTESTKEPLVVDKATDLEGEEEIDTRPLRHRKPPARADDEVR